ncbi:MAG TPA: NAD(P)(+) transhydrogenase (Re/Si-specific) subunit beta [Candidatus Acidoferrales bacterium]|jgi:NAD(P) transhydrogenase subunit beta|nr:NAD(P)(+) transhydrogenase (Re/Si-specific) subunit beta [Candidatus Acidoferrales bacterium]
MSSTTSLILIGVAVLFILGIKFLSSPKTARMGNLVAAAGMVIGFVILCNRDGSNVWSHGWSFNYTLIVIGIVIGLIIGAIGAYSVKMTAMPQMVALFNGLGGGAAALVASLEFIKNAHSSEIAGVTLPAVHETSAAFTIPMLFATLIGSLSFSGSIIAYLKLEGKFEKPMTFPGQNILNGLIGLVILGLAGWLTFNATGGNAITAFVVMAGLALFFGVAMVMPIGGADMPVVISLLNSFTGLAVAADGFAINNTAMIVAGTLVGSSGTLLTLLMCKAMNRPVTNVLFGAFGSSGGAVAAAGGPAGTVKPIQADEVALLLAYAQRVVIVPGYGMAVAQAQHSVRELSDELGKRGIEVQFAIHPVAGRMPGHMNVLLAEANVPYDQLIEMEQINPSMDRVDVCLVIGANDVVNPAAHEDKSSPIYGMPIIDADHCKTCIVMKRSMAAGFAGIENALFYKDNTRMLFGDAKASLNALVAAVKAS